MRRLTFMCLVALLAVAVAPASSRACLVPAVDVQATASVGGPTGVTTRWAVSAAAPAATFQRAEVRLFSRPPAGADLWSLAPTSYLHLRAAGPGRWSRTVKLPPGNYRWYAVVKYQRPECDPGLDHEQWAFGSGALVVPTSKARGAGRWTVVS